MLKVGDKVECTRMAADSFYRAIRGTVVALRNGHAEIEATEVMSKWDRTFEQHPGSCATSALVQNCRVI